MKTMKPMPMSESLLKLATRVQELEDSAAAARDQNRAALEARHQQLESTIDQEVQEFDAAASEATERAGTWWADTKHSIERQVTAMRADVKERTSELKAEHKRDRAERRAELAEEDAAAAIALAAYCLDAAEWAVVDAALARAEADDLAAAG
jgi:gas vesicle protein